MTQRAKFRTQCRRLCTAAMLFVLPMGQVCEAQLFSKPAIPPGSAIPVLQPPQPGYIFPAKQTLTYIVDWRVFNAGRAVFHLEQQGDTEKISATADSLGGVNLIFPVVD